MFDINLIFYGLSSMLQLPQFVWALRSSVWDVFINFLLTDAADRSKISSDQKRFFIALSLYPLSFFANTPFLSFSESRPFIIIFKLGRNFFFELLAFKKNKNCNYFKGISFQCGSCKIPHKIQTRSDEPFGRLSVTNKQTDTHTD